MKITNLKLNSNLKKKLLIGGLIISNSLLSFQIGRNTVSQNEVALESTYLSEYISIRNDLENEISDLEAQRDDLSNEDYFIMSDLYVANVITADGNEKLFILENPNGRSFFTEYSNGFEVWVGCSTPENHPQYTHLDEVKPLYFYLTDEEISRFSKNDGTIYRYEVEEIFKNINEKDYSMTR